MTILRGYIKLVRSNPRGDKGIGLIAGRAEDIGVINAALSCTVSWPLPTLVEPLALLREEDWLMVSGGRAAVLRFSTICVDGLTARWNSSPEGR